MKNLNFTTHKTLRLAASASLALVAMVASAHAQTSISHVIELRTGNDSAGAPLLIGADDGTITHSQSSGCSTSPNARSNAMNGLPAKVIQPAQAWIQTLSDQDARWIHSDHTPSGIVGTGRPAGSVQYAHRFDLPLDMPSDANVLVEMEIAADDAVGAVSFGSDSSNVFSSMYFAGGGYSFATSSTFPGTPTSLGLVPGVNYLFVKQCDTSSAFSGLIYSFKITVEYCVVEVDLRSGVTEGAAGPVLLSVGADDLSVRQVPSLGSWATLAGGGGNPAIRISPNSAWLTSLSGTAGWINPNHMSGTVNGSGRAPTSALYAHDFQLPSIPSSATVFLELEWAADETLYGVSLNADVTQPGGNLAIGGGMAPEFSFASTGQFLGTAGSLSMGQGTNSLYLSQLENYPGTSYQENPCVCSGIMYIAKLTITFPCDDAGGHDTPYETYCDCPLSVAPCSNAGGQNQGCANSTGSGSSLTASGQALINGLSTFELHADNLPTPQTVGIFLEGNNSLSGIPFGDGLRCIGQIKRLTIAITGTGEADSGIVSGPTNAGVKYYQFWYRDAPYTQSPCQFGWNLTNAIAVGWN